MQYAMRRLVIKIIPTCSPTSGHLQRRGHVSVHADDAVHGGNGSLASIREVAIVQHHRRVTSGPESADGKTRADDLMHTFEHNGHDAISEHVIPCRSKPGRLPSGLLVASLHRLIRFVTLRPAFLREGCRAQRRSEE